MQNNLISHHSGMSAENRLSHLRQKGVVVWFTGLSGSGKSTLAHEVELLLIEEGCNAFVLDGDNIRKRLNKDLGFTRADRAENIRRIAEVARLFAEANLICLVAFISPYREDRRAARQVVGHERFLEIYCAATADECERRDVKGLYKKAKAGEIKEFTGISAPYEPPENPDLILRTGGQDSLKESVTRIMTLLKRTHIIRSNHV